MSLSKGRLPLQGLLNARYLARCRRQSQSPCSLMMTPSVTCYCPVRWASEDKGKELSSIIQPIPIKPNQDSDQISVGAELTGDIKKEDILKVLNQFYRRDEVKMLAAESGLDNRLFHQAYLSFRRYCIESEALPVDLHIVFSDLLQGAGHTDDIFPYFLRHAREIFPHLDCMEDLKKISDLRLPANWYPEARALQRKIIFHAGPTNSGKTYHALQRFLNAKSGVYCGPLKLLASEVFQKSATLGTPCDLVTGEERRYADPDGEPSAHVACTVEMMSVNTPYEVAVIDEIQMMRDQQRGWAWTRALLGCCAEEVHVCGEGSAIDLVKEMMLDTGDEVEVRRYKRLTKLKFLKEAVENFDNIKRGDCIVCFSKNDIYYISRQLEKRGMECAVLYGGLPPGTKLAQAQKFNDPNDPCKVMVATDAIGMGLNLSISRVIFYSLVKPTINEKGEKEIDVIPTSHALQIAGRAGRFGTEFETGYVTTFKREDLTLLEEIISVPIDVIEQGGLHPTAEQIELFAYHLPKATLSNLIDIFVTVSRLDSNKYFMCQVEDFKFLADMIEHVPLALRVRYVFCCAPIPKQQPFVCTMFLKFARQFSRGEPLTFEWLCRQIGWPLSPPSTIADLVHLESVFDVLDLYLWLSYRFQDMFPDHELTRDVQRELDEVIQAGVRSITRLLKTSETPVSSGSKDDEYEFEIRNKNLRMKNSPEPENGIDRNKTKPRSLRDRFLKAQQAQTGKTVENARVVKEFRPSAKISQEMSDKISTGQGRLTEHLIRQGVLSEEMVEQLQKEWIKKSKNSKDD